MTETPVKKYKVTFYRVWSLVDGTEAPKQNFEEVKPGEYTVVEVPNPFGHKASWLVLEDRLKEGKTIGMAKACWFDWPSNGEDPLTSIDIEEIK